jgi:hypothetical protein
LFGKISQFTFKKIRPLVGMKNKLRFFLYLPLLLLVYSCISTSNKIMSPNFEKVDKEGIILIYLKNNYSEIANEELFEKTIVPVSKNHIKIVYPPQVEWDLRAKGFVYKDTSTYKNLLGEGEYYFLYVDILDVRDPDELEIQSKEERQMQGEPDLSKKLKLKFQLYSLQSKRFIYTAIVNGQAGAYSQERKNGGSVSFNVHTLPGIYKKSIKQGISSMVKHCGL